MNLSTWAKSYDDNEGSVPTRGRGNFESDEAKKIARFKKNYAIHRMLLKYLKKQSAYWENDRGSVPWNFGI